MNKQPIIIRIIVYPGKRRHEMRFGAATAKLLLDLFHGDTMTADDARRSIFCQFYGFTTTPSYVSSGKFCIEIDPADEKKWENFKRSVMAKDEEGACTYGCSYGVV